MWLSLCSHICQSQNNVFQIQICSRAPIGFCLSALLASPCSPVRALAPLSLRILLVLPCSPLVQLCLAVSQHIPFSFSSQEITYGPLRNAFSAATGPSRFHTEICIAVSTTSVRPVIKHSTACCVTLSCASAVWCQI